MDPVHVGVLEVGQGSITGGLRGNANLSARRQVTIMSLERWRELTAALGEDIEPAARRANVMVSGINLENSRDRVLRIGGTRLRINGETRPCERMDEACAGLQDLMKERWGGGAFAEVLDAGEITVGDPVAWELPLLD
ncbi:MAG TPA: MOSC domain-containing protein [Vicinamibacterales bacterium]|nr:MOSC domain-containing protein [Vicinamibacterales bacterium]